MTFSPDLYFWLMGQILMLYIGIAVVVCYFFRKFCQDPKEDVDEEEEDEEKNKKKKDKSKEPHGEPVTGTVVGCCDNDTIKKSASKV